MSGPYCDTCVYFQGEPLSSNSGECHDPSKAILAMDGTPVNGHARVNEKWTCSNHLTEAEKIDALEGRL